MRTTLTASNDDYVIWSFLCILEKRESYKRDKVKVTAPHESPILGISRSGRGREGCCDNNDDQLILLRRMIDHMRYIRDHFEEIDDSEDIKNEWKQIALVVDRVFAIFYVIGSIGTIMMLVFKIGWCSTGYRRSRWDHRHRGGGLSRSFVISLERKIQLWYTQSRLLQKTSTVCLITWNSNYISHQTLSLFSMLLENWFRNCHKDDLMMNKTSIEVNEKRCGF